VNGWSASRLETIADSQRFLSAHGQSAPGGLSRALHGGRGVARFTPHAVSRRIIGTKSNSSPSPTGHLLGKFHLEARGTDFIAHNGRNFLASDDEWTAPVCAEVGPDGGLWVSDWYNYIIQHNPTPRGFSTGKGAAYETPLRRTKTHGAHLPDRLQSSETHLSSHVLDKATPPATRRGAEKRQPVLANDRAAIARKRVDKKMWWRS